MSSENTSRGFAGLRVISLESRRADQMAKLIEGHGGAALVAPSMREIPLTENPAALAFARELIAGNFEVVIFLTGVGVRILFSAVETEFPRDSFAGAFSRVLVVARGPKPVAALREFGVRVDLTVPEPNTWRDILNTMDDREPPAVAAGTRIALQEYGVSNHELIQALQTRGAVVTPVPVYQWALPEDLGPLHSAIDDIIRGNADVLLLTSANQIHNLMKVAARDGLQSAVCHGLQRVLVSSIGPVATEGLMTYGIAADLEPTHPRMGQLIHETAERARVLLKEKRSRSS
jgi:uroporphyrinogen-III synthase